MAEKSVNRQNEEQKRIEAVIIGYEQGYVSYHNVKMIRLKGRDLNLLIMADFMPTLGEINGRVELLMEEIPLRRNQQVEVESVVLENVSGFFVVKNNVFKLLLKEENHDV